MHNNILRAVHICILLKITYVFCDLKTVLELHCETKTWNEAAQICKDNGGHLFKDSSSASSSQLQIFENIEPWASACFPGQAFWIGLQVDLSSTTQFFWSDCENLGVYTDWHPSDPKKPATQKCIYKMKASQNWRTSKCDAERFYICEITYGICPEDTYMDVEGSATPSSQSTENTVDGCRQSCVQASCQAFSYSPTTESCSQYESTDPFYFDDPNHRVTASIGTTFYVRHCKILTVDNGVYSYTNTDELPSVPCGSGVPAIPSTTTTALDTTTSEISNEHTSAVIATVISVSTELSTSPMDVSTETTTSSEYTTTSTFHTSISNSEETFTEFSTNPTDIYTETTTSSEYTTTASTFHTSISNSEETSTEFSTNPTDIYTETTTSSEYITTSSTFHTPISNSEETSTEFSTNPTDVSNETATGYEYATTPSTFHTPSSDTEETSTESSTNTTDVSIETTTTSEYATTPSTFHTPISNSEETLTELSTNPTDIYTETTTSSEYATVQSTFHTPISDSEETSTEFSTNPTDVSNETATGYEYATTPSTFHTPISDTEETSTESSTNATDIYTETTASFENTTTPSTFYTSISEKTSTFGMCEFVFTTVSFQNNSYCFCKNTSTLSDDELREAIKRLREELKIAKSSLSSTKLKKISVADDRPSAIAIGMVAAIALMSIAILIVTPDIVNLLLFIKRYLSTISANKCYDDALNDVFKMQDIESTKDEITDINGETNFSFQSECKQLQNVSSLSSIDKTKEFDFNTIELTV